MIEAIFNGKVIARSDRTLVVEGNHYFPREDVDPAFLEDSTTHTVCGWKGTASYHHVVVDGQRNADAAWYYPSPKPAAAQIRDHVAFWRGVELRES